MVGKKEKLGIEKEKQIEYNVCGIIYFILLLALERRKSDEKETFHLRRRCAGRGRLGLQPARGINLSEYRHL